MKFVVAKSDKVECKSCHTQIFRGEIMVQIFMKNGGRSSVMSFHAECYLIWHKDMFLRRWAAFREGPGNVERERRGRPRKAVGDSIAQERNRAMVAIRYHASKGHHDKVRSLLAELPESPYYRGMTKQEIIRKLNLDVDRI